MEIYFGGSRIVIEIYGYIVKIPNFNSYTSFLNGLISNYNERLWYNSFKSCDKLCPILFSFPFGIILIMPKVEILTEEDFEILYDKKDWYINDIQLPIEAKYDNFGFYKNRLVCVDYN